MSIETRIEFGFALADAYIYTCIYVYVCCWCLSLCLTLLFLSARMHNSNEHKHTNNTDNNDEKHETSSLLLYSPFVAFIYTNNNVEKNTNLYSYLSVSVYDGGLIRAHWRIYNPNYITIYTNINIYVGI